jgi:predicted metalloendopeptidase
MFLFIFLIIFAAFLIVWFVPSQNTSGSAREFPDAAESESSGGHVIPGLGSVASSLSVSNSVGPSDCGPGESYNTSARLCQPRVILPVGVDTELFDRDVNQCHSFYQHACGRWMKHARHKLGKGRAHRVDRSFGYLQHLNQYTLSRIIDGAAGSPIGNFYHSCVDALVNKRQGTQMEMYRKHLVHHVLDPFQSMNDLPTVFAKLIRIGFTTPITVGIEEHPSQPQMIPFFGNDGFAITDEQRVLDIFRSGNNGDELARKKTEQFLTLNRLIEHHRPDDAESMGRSMAEFVRYLSGPLFTQDIVYVNDVERLMRIHFNVNAMLRELGLTFPPYHLAWLRNKVYYMWLFGNFGPLVSHRLGQWKAYVEFSILYSTTNYFPHLPQNVFIRHGEKEEEVAPDRRFKRGLPSWKRDLAHLKVTHDDCKRLTEELLPGHVSKAFVALTQTPAMEARVIEIAHNVRRRLCKLVEETPYMTSHDKRWTVDKLEAIIIRVAHPHVWREEPFGSRLSVNNYLQNLDYIRRYRVTRQWQRWNPDDHRLNRDDMQRFNSPLSLVNAMYNPTSNTITIFAGILQYPFVHERFDDATMYATIGTVLGHEFSHALDPKGRLFDREGSFRYGARMGWWQRPTVTEYDKRIMCVIQEFGSKHVHDELGEHCPVIAEQPDNLYGQHTITEDMSDVMGVRAAYEAYFYNSTLYKEEEEDSSSKQMYMYSFAQMWCSVSTPEYECKKATHDVHAAPRVRVDSTMRHLKYFQELFVCPGETYMHNSENSMCTVFG